jgi:hypothetical protein
MHSFWLTLLSCLASAGCLITLIVFIPHDPGLRVHYSTPFTEWDGLSDMVREIPNVTCPAWAPGQPPPAALRDLLDFALCTATPWPAGVEPENRSEACRCVAGLYAGLAREGCGNATDPGVASLAPDGRAFIGDQAIRCLDRTPPYELTAGTDDFSRVFPAGLAFYCNGVVFLCSAGCLAFFALGLGRLHHRERMFLSAGQLALLACFLAVATTMVALRPLGNMLSAGALAAVYLNLAIGLHEEHARQTEEDDELDVCTYATLPQLLPAYFLAASVSGFGRDLGAYSTAMGLGALLGLALQFTWMSVGHANRRREGQQPLVSKPDHHHEAYPMGGLASGLLYLSQWLAACVVYQDRDSPYYLSRAWPGLLFVLLLALWGVGAGDALTEHGRFTRGLAPGLLVVANVILTGLVCQDASL